MSFSPFDHLKNENSFITLPRENQFVALEIHKNFQWKVARLHQIKILFQTDLSRKQIAQSKKKTKVLLLRIYKCYCSNLDKNFGINDKADFLYFKARSVKYKIYGLLNMRGPRSDIWKRWQRNCALMRSHLNLLLPLNFPCYGIL